MDKGLQSMIANLEKKTGKSFDEWVSIAKKSGFSKHGELIKFLKSTHGFTHGYANLVAMKAREAASGFTSSGEELIALQYKGKEGLFPLYKKLIDEVTKFGNEFEVAPKKTYVSLRRKKQFALIQPSTKSRMDVGINFKDKTNTDRLEKSGSFNAMCSHRVRIENINQIDNQLIEWLKEAFDQS